MFLYRINLGIFGSNFWKRDGFLYMTKITIKLCSNNWIAKLLSLYDAHYGPQPHFKYIIWQTPGRVSLIRHLRNLGSIVRWAASPRTFLWSVAWISEDEGRSFILGTCIRTQELILQNYPLPPQVVDKEDPHPGEFSGYNTEILVAIQSWATCREGAAIFECKKKTSLNLKKKSLWSL